MKSHIYPGIPDELSLKAMLESGYAITKIGGAFPGNNGWMRPDGRSFPIPALVIDIPSTFRPLGPPKRLT